VKKVFDCTPSGIIKTLNLKSPVYSKTAAYGHFGRSEFAWEQTDRVLDLQGAV
ncbi:MAG: methionine adenosyltransferase domain-containing protein, partial [Treponema sp.]|nr:methionine adenosyltransferase domain-containing protein [Treponema sp.]